MRRSRSYLFFLSFIWMGCLYAQDLITKVITVHYQPAERVAQLFKPMLTPGEVLQPCRVFGFAVPRNLALAIGRRGMFTRT